MGRGHHPFSGNRTDRWKPPCEDPSPSHFGTSPVITLVAGKYSDLRVAVLGMAIAVMATVLLVV